MDRLKCPLNKKKVRHALGENIDRVIIYGADFLTVHRSWQTVCLIKSFKKYRSPNHTASFGTFRSKIGQLLTTETLEVPF